MHFTQDSLKVIATSEKLHETAVLRLLTPPYPMSQSTPDNVIITH